MAQSNGLFEILIENLRIRALEEGEVGIECMKYVSDHREKDMVASNYLETVKIQKYQQNSINGKICTVIVVKQRHKDNL